MKIIININDRFAKFVKKICTTRNMVFTMAMVLFCAGLFIFSESVNIPNQLHEGDLIVAEELNENFRVLRDRDLDSLTDVDTSGAESGQYLKYVTGTWIPSDGDPVTGDNLGNHTAEGNLNMNGNYLSGDGDSEGVFVDEDGNVGIGTTSPWDLLHIKADLGYVTTCLEANGSRGNITMYKNAGLLINSYNGYSNPGEIRLCPGDVVGSRIVIIKTNGNVGIGTTSPNYRLQVGEISNYGWVNTDGTWGSSSDVRQKENIKDMNSGLDKILAIRSVSYNTIGSDPEKENQIGFIAQEVEEIVPEIVSTDREGYKGIAYAKLTPILVKAIQEQQELIEELKREIAELSLRVSDL